MNYNALSKNNPDEKRAKKYNKLAASSAGKAALKNAASIQKYMSKANDEYSRNKIAPKISELIYKLNVNIIKLRKVHNSINYSTAGERIAKSTAKTIAKSTENFNKFKGTAKGVVNKSTNFAAETFNKVAARIKKN